MLIRAKSTFNVRYLRPTSNDTNRFLSLDAAAWKTDFEIQALFSESMRIICFELEPAASQQHS